MSGWRTKDCSPRPLLTVQRAASLGNGTSSGGAACGGAGHIYSSHPCRGCLCPGGEKPPPQLGTRTNINQAGARLSLALRLLSYCSCVAQGRCPEAGRSCLRCLPLPRRWKCKTGPPAPVTKDGEVLPAQSLAVQTLPEPLFKKRRRKRRGRIKKDNLLMKEKAFCACRGCATSTAARKKKKNLCESSMCFPEAFPSLLARAQRAAADPTNLLLRLGPTGTSQTSSASSPPLRLSQNATFPTPSLGPLSLSSAASQPSGESPLPAPTPSPRGGAPGFRSAPRKSLMFYPAFYSRGALLAG